MIREDFSHSETGPPTKERNLNAATIVNPELWTSHALITMINARSPNRNRFLTILRMKAEGGDIVARYFLREQDNNNASE
jgi:hypothetical protein